MKYAGLRRENTLDKMSFIHNLLGKLALVNVCIVSEIALLLEDEKCVYISSINKGGTSNLKANLHLLE